MQAEPHRVSMNATGKIQHGELSPFDTLLPELAEHLTYDVDSSHVPGSSSDSIDQDRRDQLLSAVEVMLSELASSQSAAAGQLNSESEHDTANNSSSPFAQCCYLEDVPVSHLLATSDGAAGSRSETNSLPTIAITTATRVTTQAINRARMGSIALNDGGYSSFSAVAGATATPVSHQGQSPMSDVMADEVIDFHHQYPVFINDSFLPEAPPAGWITLESEDDTDMDAQVPSTSDDEDEAYGFTRRAMNSCAGDAVVPTGCIIEE